jgi:hypothetical protein
VNRLAGVVIALFVAGGMAVATTVKPMSVEEMTQAANAVVEANALDSWTQWNPSHSIIVTYTRFQVTKALKGGPLPPLLVVKQPGGIVGEVGQRMPGVRQFQAGEDAVLFLRPSATGDGSLVIVGLMQGNFRMYRASSGEVVVSNGVTGVHQMENGSIKIFHGSAMPLEQLESRVQGAQTR